MPTRRGIGVLVAGALLVGVGYRYGYPELVALGAVALVAFLAALLIAGARPGLVVERTVDPARVARDEPCAAVVNVRSTARWRSQALVGAERLRHVDGSERTVPIPPVRLTRGAGTFLRYPLPTDRRGVVDVGPLEIARRDPLGLVSASRRYGGSTRIWVHPRSHRLATVPVGASRSLDGVVDAAQYGSITFHALREYVPGDDLRHVHWRTSAHVGQLMVRQHVETSLPRIVVLLDDRTTAHTAAGTYDSLEETVEAAASVLLAALRAELHVELHLVSGRSVVPHTGDPVGAARYLDLLSEARREPDASLPTAVRQLRARHRGDTLVLLTGSTHGSDLEQLGLLRDVYPTVVAGVLAEQGMQPGEQVGNLPGVIVIAARTGEDFASRWDGVSRW